MFLLDDMLMRCAENKSDGEFTAMEELLEIEEFTEIEKFSPT